LRGRLAFTPTRPLPGTRDEKGLRRKLGTRERKRERGPWKEIRCCPKKRREQKAQNSERKYGTGEKKK